MIKFKDECCGCAAPAYPCLGSDCKNRNVPHFYCDNCEEEFEANELYNNDDEDLCQECLLLKFDTVAELIDRNEYEVNFDD